MMPAQHRRQDVLLSLRSAGNGSHRCRQSTANGATFRRKRPQRWCAAGYESSRTIPSALEKMLSVLLVLGACVRFPPALANCVRFLRVLRASFGLLPTDGLQHHVHRLQEGLALCSGQAALEDQHVIVIVIPAELPGFVLGLIVMRLRQPTGPGKAAHQLLDMLRRAVPPATDALHSPASPSASSRALWNN